MSFPATLTLADVIGDLPMVKYGCDLDEATESSEDGAGAILSARLGRPLWRGFIELPSLREDAARQVRGRLGVLRRPGFGFVFEDPQRGPLLSDPTGAIFGTSVATVAERVSDYGLRLASINADGLTLLPGDSFTILRGGQVYLNEVVTGATFSGGATPEIHVLQDLPSAIVPGDTVELQSARVRAQYVPGSLRGGERIKGRMTTPFRFDWVEARI